MKNKIKRAVISVVIFTVIYILSGYIICGLTYDIKAIIGSFTGDIIYIRAIGFLAAVIGAGCYWIGSNER